MSVAQAPQSREELLRDFRTRTILAAARRVIGEMGYAAASMDRVAQQAGVAKGTLYLYFASKEALFERAVEHGLTQLLAATRAAVAGATGARARIRAAVYAALGHMRENRDFFHAVAETRLWHPGRPNRNAARLAVFTELLADLIEEGAQSGELRSGLDTARCARMVVHGLSGLLMESLLQSLPFPAEKDIEGWLDLFFHGVVASHGDVK